MFFFFFFVIAAKRQQNFNNQPENLNLAHEFKSEIIKITIEITRGCLCDNWKPCFLPLLIFDWHTFSRRVTTWW